MSFWGNREGSDFLGLVRRAVIALETIATVLSEKVVYVKDSDRV